MASLARLPVVISAAGVARVTTAPPLHTEKFTAEIVSDPVLLAAALTRNAKAVDDGTKAARAHPESQAQYFEGFVCPGGGASVTLKHGLGHAVQWSVTDWSGAADTHNLVRTATDANSITWASKVAGTATMKVW